MGWASRRRQTQGSCPRCSFQPIRGLFQPHTRRNYMYNGKKNFPTGNAQVQSLLAVGDLSLDMKKPSWRSVDIMNLHEFRPAAAGSGRPPTGSPRSPRHLKYQETLPSKHSRTSSYMHQHYLMFCCAAAQQMGIWPIKIYCKNSQIDIANLKWLHIFTILNNIIWYDMILYTILYKPATCDLRQDLLRRHARRLCTASGRARARGGSVPGMAMVSVLSTISDYKIL